MSRIDLSKFIVSSDVSIIDAMKIINENAHRIVFVCQNGILVASLSDGDIRHHITAGKSLTAPVSEAANFQFHALPLGSSRKDINEIFAKYSIDTIPGIGSGGKLADIFFKDEKLSLFSGKMNVPVIIMAGGKGTRLYPYTKILPKPLIPIGDLTITEHIMNRFIECGCNNFTLIINHKKEMIKAYFSENEKSGKNIFFIEEDKSLGTGGGLSFLRSKVLDPFFFTNCDILVLENYSTIYKHHKESGNILTMVCATKTFSFPYGTIDVGNDGNIKAISEKPSFSFLTNTGFYIIDPRFLDHVPDDTFIHITDIIQNCINEGEKIGIFPVSEHQWLDMGNHEDMQKMQDRLSH
jgi:dTDP-glucose pyrophosphorylase